MPSLGGNPTTKRIDTYERSLKWVIDRPWAVVTATVAWRPRVPARWRRLRTDKGILKWITAISLGLIETFADATIGPDVAPR